MKLLLDTHLLLWAANIDDRLSANARQLITASSNSLFFSAASIWEIALKYGLGREGFAIDPWLFRRVLLDIGYQEIGITSEHGASVASLPPIHKDPFDRLLIAQAMVEGITLLTADSKIGEYPGPIRRA